MRLSTLALAALGCGAATALLDHPGLWPNMDWGASVLNSLPAPSMTVYYWSLGDMSEPCVRKAREDGRDPKNFKQYSVLYEDCGKTWRMCLENGHPTDINELAKRFGRLPVRMRQWVQDVIIYSSGGGAYAYGGLMVLFGTSATTPVMFHEATHTVDFGGGFYYNKPWFSDSAEWAAAYSLDTHVPDEYSRNNQHENLAGFPGLVINDRFTNGQLVRDRPEIWRIGNQLQKIADQCDWGSVYGGGILTWHGSGLKCTRRWEDQAPIYPRSGDVVPRLRRSITAEGKPDEDLTDIALIPLPSVDSYVKSNCTTLEE